MRGKRVTLDTLKREYALTSPGTIHLEVIMVDNYSVEFQRLSEIYYKNLEKLIELNSNFIWIIANLLATIVLKDPDEISNAEIALVQWYLKLQANK